MTNSEVKRIVNSNLKRRIVVLGEDGHHIVDQISEYLIKDLFYFKNVFLYRKQ